MSWTVAAFYRFVTLSDLPALQAETRRLCEANGICGTVLVAAEGINGTIAGEGAGLDQAVDALNRLFGIRQGELKFSIAAEKPFGRLKVRIREEIITMRAPEADPALRPGTYVEPKDWNALIDDPEVLVLDTRNTYETTVGAFRGALDPAIGSFTGFKDFVRNRLDPAKHRRIAMYCTGGIRCEKASAFMLAHGFEEVYHLKGGILQYLEEVPEERSLWDGACYVFDDRVAVGHGLAETVWERCYGCGFPLTPEDRQDEAYEEGVSCRHCIDALTPQKAEALRMRHAQMTDGRPALPGSDAAAS